MRGPDKKALVVALGDIVGSRQLATKSSFSLTLSFDEALEQSLWTIGKPMRKIHNLEDMDLILGVPSPHATIPMSTLLPERGLVSLPFKKPESLHLFARDSTSLEFLFIRDHMELTVYDHYHPPPPPSLPCSFLPLFYELRVLVMKCDNFSFLAGHTFHNLERCRLLREGRFKRSPSERMLTQTGMPVCTRVDIDDPWALATFKLPQIHELALDFFDHRRGVIWEKHIAVNGNLSGLNLLHMKNWPGSGDLIPILRSVPLLETLIITTRTRVANWIGVQGVDFVGLFRALLPMDANGNSEPQQTSGEGEVLGVLCPRLLHLQVESDYLVPPDQVPFAKYVATLRAEYGSPLKVFTVSVFSPKPGRKFELIGRNGSFAMEERALAGATEFKLNI